MSLVADLDINDQRVEFMADYVLKTMKLKPDKFSKCYNVDENKNMFIEFFEKHDRVTFIISANAAGVMSLSFNWPNSLKTKCVYFVKRNKEPIQKDTNIRSALLYTEICRSFQWTSFHPSLMRFDFDLFRTFLSLY